MRIEHRSRLRVLTLVTTLALHRKLVVLARTLITLVSLTLHVQHIQE